jgi:iron(III) transport system substrate-binding protein
MPLNQEGDEMPHILRTSVQASAVQNRRKYWLLFISVLSLAAVGRLVQPAFGEDGSRRIVIAQAQVTGPQSASEAELGRLTKAAQAEGSLIFYSATTEDVAKRIAAAFKAKYGITAVFVRMSGSQLQVKYASEAEANNVAADLVFMSGTTTRTYAQDAIGKGWVQSISDAGLPVVSSGRFPASFLTGPTAVVQVNPWLIVYDTDKVKGADIPQSWLDLLNPKWKGQLLIADPKTSSSYADIWTPLLEKYGESFLVKLREQNPRRYSVIGLAVESLAAGEGVMLLPIITAYAQQLQSKGVHVDVAIPRFTSGVEMHIFLTATAKAKRPTAARLFANYVMSPDGNAVFNAEAGGMSAYDTGKLPAEYQQPKLDNIKQLERAAKLLGF